MKILTVPGFKELFGSTSITYNDLLDELPSDLVISTLSWINCELNCPESEEFKQSRIRQLIFYRFSNVQQQYLAKAYSIYKNRNPHYDNSIFARRYLLAMILKEVKRNAPGKSVHDTPLHEYHFFLAYLHVIDEVNNSDWKNWNLPDEPSKDYLWDYKLLWPSNINQYEFNDDSNGPFGFVKLLSLLKYSYCNLKPFLKQYIHTNKFKTISEFLSSFYQVATSTLKYDAQKPLRKDNRIVPTLNVDVAHLRSQCINQLLGKDVSMTDLRKYPLYETRMGQFRVMDEGSYFRKLYRGPFFELYQNTSLKETKKFNQYSSEVSKGALEEICFKGVCKALQSKHDTIHFDDNEYSKPDCYYRHNKKVILIEFKDYIFPDALVINPEFEEIKRYIDERFVKSEKGKPKGVRQLVSNIQSLNRRVYKFDPQLNNFLEGKKTLTVYPVLCFSDFMFSMPGVNQYINNVFTEHLKKDSWNALIIKPVTMVNIESLFDYCYRSGSFVSFMKLIDRYWDIIDSRKRKFKKDTSTKTFLQSRVSFDEMYGYLFLDEFLKNKSYKNISVVDMVGITQEELSEIL